MGYGGQFFEKIQKKHLAYVYAYAIIYVGRWDFEEDGKVVRVTIRKVTDGEEAQGRGRTWLTAVENAYRNTGRRGVVALSTRFSDHVLHVQFGTSASGGGTSLSDTWCVSIEDG